MLLGSRSRKLSRIRLRLLPTLILCLQSQIVLAATVVVGKHFVGFRDLDKQCRRLRILWPIRMVNQNQVAIGGSNVLRATAPLKPQDLVMVRQFYSPEEFKSPLK